jgi:hypothetical protein
MAKQIVIDYTSQPATDGTGFAYSITVDGFDILYNTGESECGIEYIPLGDVPANINELAVGANLEETIQITLSYLRTVFISDLISYEAVDNTITVLVNADATIIFDETVNANIELSQSNVEPSESNLIYFLNFDVYRLNIFKENYLGNASEIFGSFTLKKSTAETILEPIRGTGLELSLEANPDLTFDEFLINDEFTYKTELLKNGNLIFKGYIKPDGVQQSYVNDEWLINVESVDGLGLLKDLSFVQDNGTQFTGKMSMYDIIKGCLDRTRLEMDINTSINIEYVGYTGSNILKDVFLDASRFIKDSNDTVIMNCNEVLTSVLNLFSGVITQQDGQWWIYRPNDLVLNGFTTFINQTTDAVFTKNLNAVLGSQIDNYYPHHCNNNQQIEVKGAISAYRINYEYGFLEGFIGNSDLDHNSDLEFDDWTVNPSLPANILLYDPLDSSGALIKSEEKTFPISLTEVMTSVAVESFQDTQLTFRTKVQTTWLKHDFYFKIYTSDGYYLNTNNEWEVGEDLNTYRKVTCGKNLNIATFNVTFELLMPPLPNDCDVFVTICRPQRDTSILVQNGRSEVTYVQITDDTLSRQGIVGEFHTVTRFDPPSSITKENQTVFNGDGGELLIGSIFKDDLITPTTQWTRVGKSEALPILGISAMDDLRIQSSPVQIFSGDVLGEIPYMSVVTINKITGIFMPIEWAFDFKTKILSLKLMQFYNFDLADILYEVSPDYGNSTVKPTIRG